MTNNVSRCEKYQRESQNIKAKYSCKPPPGYLEYLVKRGERNDNKLIAISKTACQVIKLEILQYRSNR